MICRPVCVSAVSVVLSTVAYGQNNSIYIRARDLEVAEQRAQEANIVGNAYQGAVFQTTGPVNPELEAVSIIASETRPPHEFKLNDFVTIVVREQKTYRSDSKLDNKKTFELNTQVTEFFRFLNGHLAAASFTDGEPNIDVAGRARLKGEGDAERNDRLTFRITTRIIDIRPNGQLVLEGHNRIQVDREVQEVRFTGVCRSEDIGPDNSVLSTQIYNLMVDVQHQGAVRNVASEGWLTRLLSKFSPI